MRVRVGDIVTNGGEPCYMRNSMFGGVIERYQGRTIFTVIQHDNETYYYKVLAPDGKTGFIHILDLEEIQ
jgi:hypothetical protein